jgi:hypothetical protein
LFVVHVARRLPANHSIIDACDAVELRFDGLGRKTAKDAALSKKRENECSFRNCDSLSGILYVRFTSTPAPRVVHLLCQNLRHDHARHFRIKPANAVAADDKVRRIEDMAFDEIQHRAVGPSGAQAPLHRK